MNLVTAFLQRLYRAAQSRYPDVLYQGNDTHRQLALTFDDGPHPLDTPRLLEVLEKHEVHATFHLVGKSAERHPDLVQSMCQCGHQLALHGYRHLPFPLEESSTLRAGLERSRQAIAVPTGMDPAMIRDLRPPYGIFTDSLRSRLAEWGYRLVMWNCIPPHWMQPVGWSIRQVLASVVPGSVIVLHDGHGHGRRVAEIVDAIVPQIRSCGFDFITVEEMQKQRNQAWVHLNENEETV